MSSTKALYKDIPISSTSLLWTTPPTASQVSHSQATASGDQKLYFQCHRGSPLSLLPFGPTVPPHCTGAFMHDNTIFQPREAYASLHWRPQE